MNHIEQPLRAYEDVEFLNRDVCRSVRLQLEFLKPEVIMDEKNIHSTIVLFGSARIPSPEVAEEALRRAEWQVREKPDCPEFKQKLRRARLMKEQSTYYALARDFAALVSKCSQTEEARKFVIITGGGGGIMEAGNRGAADVGAKSIGLNISLPHEQAQNPFITEGLCFYFHYFSIRKMHFLKRARAMCAFPGGLGTMDELFEALTLIQTKKIEPMPVVLFGREYWDDIINWQALVDRGLIAPEDLDIFRVCETAEEGWDYIRNFWNYNGHGPE